MPAVLSASRLALAAQIKFPPSLTPPHWPQRELWWCHEKRWSLNGPHVGTTVNSASEPPASHHSTASKCSRTETILYIQYIRVFRETRLGLTKTATYFQLLKYSSWQRNKHTYTNSETYYNSCFIWSTFAIPEQQQKISLFFFIDTCAMCFPSKASACVTCTWSMAHMYTLCARFPS